MSARQMALEALHSLDGEHIDKAIAALRAELAQAVEPVMFGIQSVNDGSFFAKVAVVGWVTFPKELAQLELEQWVIAGRAKITPLFAAPQEAAAQWIAVSERMPLPATPGGAA